MFFFGFSPPKTGPEWHPRESPPISPQTCWGPGACQAAAATPTTLPPQLKSVGPAFFGEMLDADRRWGSGRGGGGGDGAAVTGSGPHSPSLHLPSNPAPSVDEVTSLPHGEMSVSIAAGGSAGAFGSKSSLKCQVVFMFPAYRPSTGRDPLVPKCPANKALSHAFLGTSEPLRAPRPSPSIVPSEAQGQRE